MNKLKFILFIIFICCSCGHIEKSSDDTTISARSSATVARIDISPNKPSKNKQETNNCLIVYRSSMYFYNLINVDQINRKGLSYIFPDGFRVSKTIIENPNDLTVLDTLFKIESKRSFVELSKAHDARTADDGFSGWIRASIKDKGVHLGGGLKIGSSRAELAKILESGQLTCDTIRLNTEEMTYDNYIVLQNDTIREVNLMVTAD